MKKIIIAGLMLMSAAPVMAQLDEPQYERYFEHRENRESGGVIQLKDEYSHISFYESLSK